MGEDGNGLKVYGEGPEDFENGEIGMNKDGENGTWNDDKFDAEVVFFSVQSGLEFEVDKVDGGIEGGNKEELKRINVSLRSNEGRIVE